MRMQGTFVLNDLESMTNGGGGVGCEFYVFWG